MIASFDVMVLAEGDANEMIIQERQKLLEAQAVTETFRREISIADDRLKQLGQEREAVAQEIKSLTSKFKLFIQGLNLTVASQTGLMNIFRSSPSAGKTKKVGGDIPVGVDSVTFAKVGEFRDVRKEMHKKEMILEAALKEAEEEHVRLEAEIANAEKLEDAARVLILQAERKVAELKLSYPLILHIPLEKVEVTQAPIVTDYSNSVLVSVSRAIQPVNDKVKSLGQQKLATVSEIQRFKRKVVLLDWELAKLSIQAADVKETSKDLHLAKVHRDVKKIMAEGSKPEEKQLEMIFQTQKYAEQVAAKKLKSLRKRLNVHKAAVAEKVEQNRILAERLDQINAADHNTHLSDEAIVAIEENTKIGQKKNSYDR
jgi:hypothetical protein